MIVILVRSGNTGIYLVWTLPRKECDYIVTQHVYIVGTKPNIALRPPDLSRSCVFCNTYGRLIAGTHMNIQVRMFPSTTVELNGMFDTWNSSSIHCTMYVTVLP